MTRAVWSVQEAAWGGHEPAPLAVAAGPWSFELRGDELADLAFDGSQVVRSVRAVVRDQDWVTVPVTVSSVVARPDGCDLMLAMNDLGADIRATMEVRADDHRISVRLAATSRTEFRSNRLGLVVLHPPVLAGAELAIGTPGGEVVQTAFPVSVSPHQPAMDIRSLAWTHDGVATTTTFAGDVFEMEDQRNWTDASYKTYSTPLARAFPVTIPAGAVIEQSVDIDARRVAPRADSDAPPGGERVVVLIDTGQPVPGLTLGASTVPDPDFSPARLPDGLSGILVELDMRTLLWRAALARAAGEADGTPLDVRITADDPAAVRDAVDAVAEAGTVARLGVFAGDSHVTEPELWAALTDAAGRRLPEAELVGGARSHFTELNRQHHRLPVDLSGIVFAMTPQMHATERAQLVESVAVQATLVRDAARIATGRPLHVGPITLSSRFNAVVTSDRLRADDATLLAGYGAQLVSGATDARQSSPALAAWTVASFAAICAGAAAGDGVVATVDYFETTGPRGIRDRSGAFPVARAIELLASMSGARLLVPDGALPEGIRLVGGERGDGSWHSLVASLADHAVPIVVRHRGRDLRRTVAPYEVAVLDSNDH